MMPWRRHRVVPRWIAGAAALAAVVCAVGVALAAVRPGGGNSYSGGGGSGGGGFGGGSSGGGGSDGGGDGLGFLVWLCFQEPEIGIPILIIVIVVAVLRQRNRSQMQSWSSGGSFASAPYVPLPPPPPAPRNIRREIDRLRATDPNFSFVLFEDFLYALYAEVHRARGRGQLARYSAYLGPGVAPSMQGSAGVADVRNIVIGAMSFREAFGTRGDAPKVVVCVRFEANYTEVQQGGAEQSYYAEEDWTLSRKRGVVSRTPDRARVFACPSCGAPLDAVSAGTCMHCGKLVSDGDFDWVLERAEVVSRTPRGPMLTGDTPERGTDLPTIVDPAARGMMSTLLSEDPSLTWPAFQARVGLIFSDFQAAWAARDLAAMRGYLSDRLFETQIFWVEAYKAQHLRNVTEGARIVGLELARVERDAFFDAVTVRLWATSKDFTVTEDGSKVVAGSRTHDRRYSEYWTLIRSTKRKGPTRAERVCPNCGAPLQINMAGVCTYCNAKVTSGDFDWVLSRIEQDESYAG